MKDNLVRHQEEGKVIAMSRCGYTEDFDSEWALNCWRGQVTSSIRGKRGQAFLREMLAALDAMPVKRLIAHELQRDGEVCALGVVGVARGIDLAALDPEQYYKLAEVFGIAHQLVREIEYINDDDLVYRSEETVEQRWRRVHNWVTEQLRGGGRS